MVEWSRLRGVAIGDCEAFERADFRGSGENLANVDNVGMCRARWRDGLPLPISVLNVPIVAVGLVGERFGSAHAAASLSPSGAATSYAVAMSLAITNSGCLHGSSKVIASKGSRGLRQMSEKMTSG